MATDGSVTWLNPPEKTGKVTDAAGGLEHPFSIPGDLADPAYSPQVGDQVTYDVTPGNTASNIAKSGEPKSR